MNTINIEKLILNVALYNDEVAFRELFDHYYDNLKIFAQHYVKTSQNAEEVVTDVFVKLWNNRSKLIAVNNLQAYLYTITKRESLNYIRNHKLNTHLFVQLDGQFKVASTNPEEEFLYSEILQVLTNAVNELPEKCRVVFTMIKENGMKYKEVAALLDISEKAVEMHIAKALQRIRAALSEYQKIQSYSSGSAKNAVSVMLLILLSL